MASLLGEAPPRERVIARLADAFSRVWERPLLLPGPYEALPDIPFSQETSHV